MGVDAITQSIRDEWAAKDAHYAAHPVELPRAQDGNLITVGQRVKHEPCYDGSEGVITEVKIRCYGNPRIEDGWYRTGEPMQQVWVFINGRNCIHRPEDIIEVLA